MPRTSENISARTTSALKTALDAWFTANDGVYIRYFQLTGADLGALNGTEMSVSIMLESGGNQQASPLVANFYTGITPEAVQTQVDTAIAASPNSWYQGPFLINLSKRRRSSPWIALLLSCTDAVNAAANWTPS